MEETKTNDIKEGQILNQNQQPVYTPASGTKRNYTIIYVIIAAVFGVMLLCCCACMSLVITNSEIKSEVQRGFEEDIETDQF